MRLRIPPDPRVAAIAHVVELDDVAVFVLRVMLVAERSRHVYDGLRHLARSPHEPGIAVDALIAVAEGMGHDERAVLTALAPTAPLLARGLLAATHPDGPTLACRISVPERVLQVLVDGTDRPPVDLPLVAEPSRPVDDPGVADDVVETLRHHVQALDDCPLWIVGADGVGQRALVAALAAELGVQALALDHRLVRERPAHELVPILWREVLLQRAVIVIHAVEATEDGVPPARLYAGLARAALPIVFAGREAPALDELEPLPALVSLAMPDDRAR